MIKKVLVIVFFSIVSLATFGQSGVATYISTPTNADSKFAKRTYDVYFKDTLALIVLHDSFDVVIINEKNYKSIYIAPYTRAVCNYARKNCSVLKYDKKDRAITAKRELFVPNWEIDTTQKREIRNYRCYKATRKFFGNGEEELVEAWFCPELKTSANPSLADGLPGLMFEQSSKYEVIKIEKLLIKEVDVKMFSFVNAIEVSYDKFSNVKSKTKSSYERAVKATEAEINKD
jgi:GLPGLI family protein